MSNEDPNGIDQHSPGAKLDKGKPNLALVFGGFHQSLSEVGEVGTYGSLKYTPEGWKSVKNGEQRYLSAALRHILAHLGGEENDPESGLPHLSHASWNCLASRQVKINHSSKSKIDHRKGLICPHCGTYNTHEEAGTYQVMNPCCKRCQNPTEGG